MSDEQPRAPRGFAGLGDLVSKVEVPPPPPLSLVDDAPRPASSAPAASPVRSTVRTRPAPASSGSAMKIVWWTGGILVALCVVLAIGKKSARTDPSLPVSTGTPPAPPVAVVQPVRGSEEQPPIGQGLVLSQAQIRYCVSEKIRMASWQGAVNSASSRSVSAFNAAVDSYNARCGHYKYRSGALQGVESEVQGRRAVLQQEGLAKAAANP